MARQLESPGPYLLGARFSAADILLVHCCDWAEIIGGEWAGWAAEPGADDDGFDALRGYLRTCRARGAYVRAKAMAPGPRPVFDAPPGASGAPDQMYGM